MTHSRFQQIPRILPRLASGVGILLLFVLHGTYFSVPEGFAVVVTRLGRPVQVIMVAGPCCRLPPPVDQIHLIDCRRQIVDTPQTTSFTRDKKSVVLTTFVVWHVDDALLFMQAAVNAETAASNLAGIVTAAKSQEVSRHDLSALVSVHDVDLRTDAIEARLTQQVNRIARERLGIVVDKVGFQRIALPRENVVAVLEKMRAERETEAGRLRSEGAKAAQAIRDEAHVKSQEVLRRGREEASRITANAERQAAESFARVHDQAPEFYRFWSSLQASKRALGKNAVLVLRSDRAFFEPLLQTPAEGNRLEHATRVESNLRDGDPGMDEQAEQP